MEIIEKINELVKIPLDADYVLKKIGKRINLLLYSDLAHYKHIKDCLINNMCLLLLESKPNFGHWTLILYHPDRDSYEGFNSYGSYIDDDLVYIKENMREMLGEEYPLLTALFYDSGKTIEYSDHVLQSKSPEVSTCGYYCIMRAIWSDVDVDEYARRITSYKDLTPDQAVVAFVLLLN